MNNTQYPQYNQGYSQQSAQSVQYFILSQEERDALLKNAEILEKIVQNLEKIKHSTEIIQNVNIDHLPLIAEQAEVICKKSKRMHFWFIFGGLLFLASECVFTLFILDDFMGNKFGIFCILANIILLLFAGFVAGALSKRND